jgi:hypothetical protein
MGEKDDNASHSCLAIFRRFSRGINELSRQSRVPQAISERFDIEWQEVADWCIQARITKHETKNITINQQRYALSITNRYILNTETPMAGNKIKYASPLPTTFKWSKEGCLTTRQQIEDLESEFGFKMRAMVGSLIYLANTAYEEIFTICNA